MKRSLQVLRLVVPTLLGVICLWSARPVFAWGPQGHRVIAVIAQSNLTPQGREKINALLGPYNSLAAISSWADDTRPDYAETGPWHYIDIPIEANSIDMAAECPQSNCVIGQIEKFEGVLKDAHASEADRRVALEFLVHFVGDLHQPLHAVDNDDKGGNLVQVVFFGQPSNLHSVWDSGILNHVEPYGNKLAEELGRGITPAEREQWGKGSVEDWALESHRLAREVAYKNLPPGPPPLALGQAYVDATAPAVKVQLEKAGIRLAKILNQALR